MANNPLRQLAVIRNASAKGSGITDVYRLMYQRDLWLKAYAKLAPNPGNLTPGTDHETMDGTSLKVIDDLREQLQQEAFRFSPVKRRYIPKKNGKMRPLGVPTMTSYCTSYSRGSESKGNLRVQYRTPT